MSNAIEWGLSNVHYAKITGTDTSTGAYTYGDVKPIPGAVSMSLTAQGSNDPFYADNIIFKALVANAGYSGDYTFANLPDDFRENILGETVDKNGAFVENSDAVPAEFALLFQFEGDVNATRHILWRCSTTRPDVEGDTKEDKVTPKTKKLTITAMPRTDNHNVKASLTADKTGYSTFFSSVYEPVAKTTESDGSSG